MRLSHPLPYHQPWWSLQAFWTSPDMGEASSQGDLFEAEASQLHNAKRTVSSHSSDIAEEPAFLVSCLDIESRVCVTTASVQDKVG